jgi:hypothetical protein
LRWWWSIGWASADEVVDGGTERVLVHVEVGTLGRALAL